MKITIISLNYSPENIGIGKYNTELAEYLTDAGHDIEIITAPPYYPDWELSSKYNKFWFETENINNVKVMRCPIYVPKKVTTVSRLFHLASFAITSTIRLVSTAFKRKDIILLVQPTFFCAPSVILFSKLFKVRTIMHIQDYELDAMLGLGMASKNSMFSRTLKRIESFITNRFDQVSSISLSMLDRARNLGVKKDKLVLFPNWADINFVTPETSSDVFRDKLNFDTSDKIVLYSGNIGKKQGLEIVLDVAKRLEHDKSLKFLLVGTGAHIDTLKKYSRDLNLNNITFLPLQAWQDVPYLLAMADLHLVIQKKGVADAVLPSKLTNILAVGGHSIVTAEPNTELGRIENKFPGIYTLIPPEDTAALEKAIRFALENTNIDSHNKVARDYAEKYLSKSMTINNFISDISRSNI
ncbi:MAG: WcaI family glycosyltransferase [Flavobacteriaceae bacterium]|nr:WcaI family glycosyltransferase [Flavobacteriaceae bacterium]